ncbi:MAG: DUF805 domain-containing protein [Patescibacteria group bacterium]|jgi:uncharacterized membrane protein YhaH (DUF805 family)
MDYYLAVLKKYAVFSGRATRAEYWYFVLFNLIISAVLVTVWRIFGGAGYGPLQGLYSLAVLIPSLAVLARRLHDTNHSGWWILIAFLPVIGAIVLLVFAVSDSQPGANGYGPNPKEVKVS